MLKYASTFSTLSTGISRGYFSDSNDKSALFENEKELLSLKIEKY